MSLFCSERNSATLSSSHVESRKRACKWGDVVREIFKPGIEGAQFLLADVVTCRGERGTERRSIKQKETTLSSSGKSHLLQKPNDAKIKKWLYNTVRKR